MHTTVRPMRDLKFSGNMTSRNMRVYDVCHTGSEQARGRGRPTVIKQ